MHLLGEVCSSIVNMPCVMFRYCNPSYSFPSQHDVVDFAVRTATMFLDSHPKAIVVVGSYTIGKERIFAGMLLVVFEFFSVSSIYKHSIRHNIVQRLV